MKKLTLAIMALLLTSCASQPRAVFVPPTISTTAIPLNKLYQKRDYFNFASDHGYKNSRKGKNSYAIVYSGVLGLHVDIALDFALLRAAELCKIKNLPYFGTSKINTQYQKKRYETEYKPVVFMDIDCYVENISPALYSTNTVLVEINRKIDSGTLSDYKSIVKRKPTKAKETPPPVKKQKPKNLIY